MQPCLAITWRQSQTAPSTWCGLRHRSSLRGTFIAGTPSRAPASTVGVVRSARSFRRRRRRFFLRPPAVAIAPGGESWCFFSFAVTTSSVTSRMSAAIDIALRMTQGLKTHPHTATPHIPHGAAERQGHTVRVQYFTVSGTRYYTVQYRRIKYQHQNKGLAKIRPPLTWRWPGVHPHNSTIPGYSLTFVARVPRVLYPGTRVPGRRVCECE